MPWLIKNLIITSVIVFGFFVYVNSSVAETINQSVYVSDNTFGHYANYIERTKLKIQVLEEKVRTGTATLKDKFVLDYYKARIVQLENPETPYLDDDDA